MFVCLTVKFLLLPNIAMEVKEGFLSTPLGALGLTQITVPRVKKEGKKLTTLKFFLQKKEIKSTKTTKTIYIVLY